MKNFSKNSIDNLKEVAQNDQLIQWKKTGLFKSQTEILSDHQEEFEKWIKLFITNHKSWLVKSAYNDELENYFDHEFEKCLDKLDEDRFKNVLKFIEENDDVENNIPVSIFLLEAVRFGYKQPNSGILKQETFHQRQVNPEITKVFEIHFPESYQRYIDLRYERMLYFELSKKEIKQTHKFGGIFNDLEKDGINRIITIDPLPQVLQIKSVTKLTIGFNFDKAFWIPIAKNSPYFLQHNLEGEPIKELTTIAKMDIEFYKENPLHECEVLIKETPKKYIHHPISKNEWRIGGMPNWVQEPQKLNCPTCGENMKFIIQLPSGDLKDIKNEGVYYGSDGGTTYGFWCDTDQVMGYIWQDT